MATVDLTEGWTAGIPFTLKANDVVVNLTGMTVTLILRGNDAVLIDTAGDVAVTDAVNGVVTYTPDLTDVTLALAPFRAHFKVVDGTGGIAYFPNGAADTWLIHRQ